MSAVSQTIGNVLGGISSQPDSVKYPGQVRHAENVYLDPTFGCSKRQGTEFIKNLGTDIPEDAKWFTIFRSKDERYVVCSYRGSNSQILRVFTADTGEERPVNLEGSAADYIAVIDNKNLKPLTVNDYTFLVNSEKTVLMNGPTNEENNFQGLVVVNQIAYNTTYAVDFLRDGEELNQIRVNKASALSVSPASFEDLTDEGACGFADTESFVKDGSGDQTGLGFKLETSCNPTLVTEKVSGNKYPTRLDVVGGYLAGITDRGFSVWCSLQFGDPYDYAVGSYLYTDQFADTEAGTLDYRVEARVVESERGGPIFEISGIAVINYTIKEETAWRSGITIDVIETTTKDIVQFEDPLVIIPAGSTCGIRVTVTAVQEGEEETRYSYKSVYKTRVSLNNGGANWNVGDTVNVTMAGKDYVVTVDETVFGFSYEAEASASYTTPADTEAGVLNINDIVSNLVTEINGIDNYSASPVGNVVVITRTDDRDFNLMTRGGTANNALYGLKGSVNDVSLLPPQCQDGILLRVSNSDASDADDYYVKFKTEGGIPGQGAWEETVKPGIATSINPATMPHALIREDDGSFNLRPLTKEYDEKNYWQDRKVGDNTTAPVPTFIDKTINDSFFYQNRLGFLSDDTVVMSQAGDYFNFFQGSAIAISDADPIDMSVSTTRPATLKSAMGTPAGLLMFAENSQFLMSTQDVAFGPSTVKIDESSSFSYKSDIHPVETGVSILFTTEI
jgi:hypothetical protein